MDSDSMRAALKQRAMRPGANEYDHCGTGELINEQEITAHVTLPMIRPVAGQRVVAPLRR